jgi:hypothetical protein
VGEGQGGGGDPVAQSFASTVAVWAICLQAAALAAAADPIIDLSAHHAESGINVRQFGDQLRLSWPVSAGFGELDLDLRPGRPLIRAMAITGARVDMPQPVLEYADPVNFLLVGSRQEPADRPPGMSVFNVFFDSPATRPFQVYRSKLEIKHVRVASQGHRATVSVGDVTIGPFTGELRFTLYRGAALVHVESVVHTSEDRRAILYDTGLALQPSAAKTRFAWVDTEGNLRREAIASESSDRHQAVRHRALIAETDSGSVACFPPPHQFFSPRDLTDNLSTVWFGREHRGLESRFGFGIRQSERGGGSWVPWFNAPPGTDQRLGVFFLLSAGDAERALSETLRYTNGDRFPKLPGYHTMTSHWHMATAMTALEEKARGIARSTPDVIGMFKAMGVEIVHLAEFHGDGHPQDPGPLRLPELESMFAECKRLSDGTILVLPGEEANTGLGTARPGKEAGHWMYLFPRPVYWTMKRASGQTFEENRPPFGTIYNVGNGSDMVRLLEREHGLAWSSHPRIKGSSWTPDFFRGQDFYRSDRWLGAAWKAMPADLSLDRLGSRALDLLDDMANWGQQKYLPGEVDVFKIDHTHELYGHMNINYIRLEPDRVPRLDEGWQPVLDALRTGRFFVTTGEVLIPEFLVAGQSSGSTVGLEPGRPVEVRFELKGTFPLRFAEIISGDGSRVFRDRIDLADTGSFSEQTIRHQLDLTGRKWVRLEAWDVATNGCYTQPIWLGALPSR